MKSAKKNLVSYCHYFFLSLFLLLIMITQGCVLFGGAEDDHGEFKTSIREAWVMEAPRDMVFIPGGSFMMGEVDQDIVGKINPNRRVTVSPFFMDDTEITNSTYRKFIEVVQERFNTLNENQDPSGNVDPTSGGDQPKDKLEEMLSDEFIMTKLYPDSNVWREDFIYNMSDIFLKEYFDHPAFDNYPVVGVSWEAARFFADWRTKYFNENQAKHNEPPYPSFSLPSAAQWEYAARGGNELAKYPWGGPYIRDHEGKLRANFKSGKGAYIDKESEVGYAYTSPVNHFPPNDYGLYDMAGNVAEWTLDAYNPAAIARISAIDPLFLDDNQPMKIIKGGSWKDISRFLQTGVSDYEHKDSTRSYIGFRCVIPYIGAHIFDK